MLNKARINDIQVLGSQPKDINSLAKLQLEALHLVVSVQTLHVSGET